MKRPTPIYTDRLEAALRHFGIPSNLKRSTLTEIIARTFGYRNTNDMAALISRDHTPPMAQIHPAADLITLLDPETSEPFGISKALISAASLRKNQFILAPSGTLLDISALTKQAERPSTLDNLAISLPGFDPDNQVPARLEDNEKSLTIRFDLGPWLKQLSPFPDPANEEFTEILDARLTEIITPDLAADYKDMADLIESVELKTGKDNPIWLRYDEDDVLNWLRNNQPETYAVAVECELCTPLYTDDKGETIPAISIGDWIAMIRRDPLLHPQFQRTAGTHHRRDKRQ